MIPDFPEFPHVHGIHCICRECGALCTPEGWHDRGGLCARCAFPTRVTTNAHSLVASGQRTAAAIEATARAIDNVVPFEPDPIRDAIDRAAAVWSRDNEDTDR